MEYCAGLAADDTHAALSLLAAAPLRHDTSGGGSTAGFVAHGAAMEEDWTWSVGAHPLGPLSNATAELSMLLVDAVRQHALAVTLHHAARLVSSVRGDIARGAAAARNLSIADGASHAALAEAEAALHAAVGGNNDVASLARAERAYQRALALRAAADVRLEADAEALRCCQAAAAGKAAGANAVVWRHGARAAFGWAALGLTSFALLFIASGGAGEASSAIAASIAKRRRSEVPHMVWSPGLL